MALTKMTPQGEVPMTKDEEVAFLAEQAAANTVIQAAALRAAAIEALKANDIVAVRCLKAGVVYPSAWQDYDKALRTIIDSGTGTLPQRPDYPSGT
jgi:hypothetical protein